MSKLLTLNIKAFKSQVELGKISTITDIESFFCKMYRYSFTEVAEDKPFWSIIEVLEEVKEITFILDSISGMSFEASVKEICRIYEI